MPPGGFVRGPASSTPFTVPYFTNTSGNQLNDSNVLITDITLDSNNLSDLTDIPTARSNLGLGSIALQNDPLTETHGGTGQISYSTGDILYASGPNTLAKLSIGTSGQALTVSAGLPIWSTPSGGTVTSVSGTANRITSTGGTTPVIDIAATYVGQTSITTLGTISTGTWQGTVISPTYGGTGVNNGSSTLTLGGNLATSGAFASTFTMTGATSVTFPTSGTLATTSQIPSLPLSLANGGTNANLTANNGGIFYSTSTAGAILAGTATARQMLQSGASSAPAWSTTTWPATSTVNRILYSSATNVIGEITTANNSIVLTDGSGVPSLGISLSNDFTFTKSTSGATTTLTVSETSNTASSSAVILAQVAGSTAADSVYQATISGGQAWSWGLDNSDSDSFVIAASSALGTTNVMRVATTGEINYPLQSAFLAGSTLQSSVTGDGTTYTITYTSEIFDQNSDFDGTSTFTAPVTGRYQLSCNLCLGGLTASHTNGICLISTSNRDYNVFTCAYGTIRNSGNAIRALGSILADMDAADTCTITIQVSGGTKVVNVLGSPVNYFSGILLA